MSSSLELVSTRSERAGLTQPPVGDRYPDGRRPVPDLQVGPVPEPQAPAARLDRLLPQDVRPLPSCLLAQLTLAAPPADPPSHGRTARCESCIERIFSLGPAPCPTCGVLNRKAGFGGQTFEDLRVEEEVDIRRRVARECVPPPSLLPPSLCSTVSCRAVAGELKLTGVVDRCCFAPRPASFNKRRDDFVDGKAYNDYLEEVEDISCVGPFPPSRLPARSY